MARASELLAAIGEGDNALNHASLLKYLAELKTELHLANPVGWDQVGKRRGQKAGGNGGGYLSAQETSAPYNLGRNRVRPPAAPCLSQAVGGQQEDMSMIQQAAKELQAAYEIFVAHQEQIPSAHRVLTAVRYALARATLLAGNLEDAQGKGYTEDPATQYPESSAFVTLAQLIN
eukprot:1208438-Pyramimonas_sp.AAC.1